MRLITLNTWGGRAGKERLLAFLNQYKGSVDVFCLQEIWSAAYEEFDGLIAGGKKIDHSQIMVHGLQEISALLSEFTPYFRPHHGDHYGLLMLVKKSLEINAEGEVYVYKEKGYVPEGDVGTHARNIQFVTTKYAGTPLTIINFHGLWNGKGKGDCEDRLNQSKKIKKFLDTQVGNKILCGDFNLRPDTESLKILERGMRNLIKDYSITSTRTSFYTKPEKFADYILTSPDIKIKDFKVLSDEVSDHSPLLLEV